METKVEVFEYLFERIKEMLPIEVIKAKFTKGGLVTYKFENNCSIEFDFATYWTKSLGKNSFYLHVFASLKNPFLCNLLLEPFLQQDIHKANSQPKIDSFEDDLFFYFNSHDKYKYDMNWHGYVFSNEVDKKILADKFLEDLKKSCFPFIIPLVKQYDKIIDFYSELKYVQGLARGNQFSFGVLLALLQNKEEFIEEKLIPLAKEYLLAIGEKPLAPCCFADYNRTINYVTEIVEPIKKYIAENNLSMENIQEKNAIFLKELSKQKSKSSK